MNTLRLGWRNLWRNGARTAVNLTAMAVSTAALIVTSTLILGLLDQVIRNATNLGVGEVQVHAQGYLAERSLQKSLAEADAILAAARGRGVSAAPRALGVGLLSLGNRSAGVSLSGVEPAAERELGALPTHLEAGGFLADAPEKGVVLGRRLARSLGAGIGSEVALVVQAADGSVGGELLRVRGILASVGEGTDRGLALIHRADFEEIFSLQGKVHEVAITSHGEVPLAELVAAIQPAAGGADVRSWRALLPAVASVVDVWNGMTVLIGLIFFLAAGLGVLNTMLMASYERIPEFGLLKALGTTPLRIVRDVAAEAFMLGMVSTALGGVVGFLIALFAAKHGINLAALEGNVSLSGVAMDSVWRAKLTAPAVLAPIAVMWSVAVLAALYPAIKAARLDPVKSLTHV